jgi:hypothetical protein
MFEVVESRCLMAADLQIDNAVSANPSASPVYLKATTETRTSDVNLDGVINHRDAHAVLAFLNARSANDALAAEGEASRPQVTAQGATAEQDMDINGDGETGPLDVFWIVNQIQEYDPLTPCDCGACSQPTSEGRCENASLAQAQSASAQSASTWLSLAPAAELAGTSLESLAAAQSLEEFLRNRSE